METINPYKPEPANKKVLEYRKKLAERNNNQEWILSNFFSGQGGGSPLKDNSGNLVTKMKTIADENIFRLSGREFQKGTYDPNRKKFMQTTPNIMNNNNFQFMNSFNIPNNNMNMIMNTNNNINMNNQSNFSQSQQLPQSMNILNNSQNLNSFIPNNNMNMNNFIPNQNFQLMNTNPNPLISSNNIDPNEAYLNQFRVNTSIPLLQCYLMPMSQNSSPYYPPNSPLSNQNNSNQNSNSLQSTKDNTLENSIKNNNQSDEANNYFLPGPQPDKVQLNKLSQKEKWKYELLMQIEQNEKKKKEEKNREKELDKMEEMKYQEYLQMKKGQQEQQEKKRLQKLNNKINEINESKNDISNNNINNISMDNINNQSMHSQLKVSSSHANIFNNMNNMSNMNNNNSPIINNSEQYNEVEGFKKYIDDQYKNLGEVLKKNLDKTMRYNYESNSKYQSLPNDLLNLREDQKYQELENRLNSKERYNVVKNICEKRNFYNIIFDKPSIDPYQYKPIEDENKNGEFIPSYYGKNKENYESKFLNLNQQSFFINQDNKDGVESGDNNILVSGKDEKNIGGDGVQDVSTYFKAGEHNFNNDKRVVFGDPNSMVDAKFMEGLYKKLDDIRDLSKTIDPGNGLQSIKKGFEVDLEGMKNKKVYENPDKNIF